MSWASIRLASARLNWSRETISAKCSSIVFIPAGRSRRASGEIAGPESEDPQDAEVRRRAKEYQTRDRRSARRSGGAEPPALRSHREPQRDPHCRQSGCHLQRERSPTRLRMIDTVFPVLTEIMAGVVIGPVPHRELALAMRLGACLNAVHELG